MNRRLAPASAGSRRSAIPSSPTSAGVSGTLSRNPFGSPLTQVAVDPLGVQISTGSSGTFEHRDVDRSWSSTRQLERRREAAMPPPAISTRGVIVPFGAAATPSPAAIPGCGVDVGTSDGPREHRRLRSARTQVAVENHGDVSDQQPAGGCHLERATLACDQAIRHWPGGKLVELAGEVVSRTRCRTVNSSAGGSMRKLHINSVMSARRNRSSGSSR